MNKPFDIEAFSDLPECLKPSDYVDMLLFLSFHKPVIRLGKNSDGIYSLASDWCNRHSFRYFISTAGFMYIARKKFLPFITSFVDDLPFPHATLLGKLLGYPKCCTHKITELGENKIDEWELTEFGDELLTGEYSLINPKLYTKGTALISHVPCSNRCEASLRLAYDMKQIIIAHRDNKYMQRWSWILGQ